LVYQSFGINANISSFFNDMPDRIACAHLVICRAGASTIAELTTIGRPAILVPYRYAVDDHQSQNAYAVDEMGGGWLIPEHNFTDNILADRLESLLSVPEILKNAGAAAKAGGVPNAASRLADLIIDLMPSNFTTDYGKSL
jgi:UDP-N-acetylglucosamine--N-acetylmuramyl-(pentapeptide) pyrophosphoryl-undecaprenol N-acetylglucosamine transferase